MTEDDKRALSESRLEKAQQMLVSAKLLLEHGITPAPATGLIIRFFMPCGH